MAPIDSTGGKLQAPDSATEISTVELMAKRLDAKIELRGDFEDHGIICPTIPQDELSDKGDKDGIFKGRGDCGTDPTNENSNSSMALNDAFEALEQMRRANLEVEFGHNIDFGRCVECLRNPSPKKRILSFRRSSKRNHKPCLLCGQHTCKKHSSKPFLRGSKTTICMSCAPLLSLDFIVDCVSEDGESQKHRENINRMVDIYDRVMLILKYSAQYIDEVATQLEISSKRNDRFGIGGASSGLASGIAGVAAAAAIFTPAGPPLLIASLLFGGTAQACYTGSKTVNYYSSPRRLASKIIAYYNLCKSVLLVTCILRDALLNNHIDLENYAENIVCGVHNRQGSWDETCNTTTADREDDSFSEGDSIASDWMMTADETDVRIEPLSPSKVENQESRHIEKHESPTRYDIEKEEPYVMSCDGCNEESIANDDDDVVRVVAAESLSKSSKKEDMTKERADDSINTTPSESNRPLSPKTTSIVKTGATGKTISIKDAGRSARFLSRSTITSSSLAGVASFAYVAGGALSLAHIAIEAKSMAETVKRIQKGSPCSKAEILRTIKDDIKKFPGTSDIMKEWNENLDIIMKQKEERQVEKEFVDDVGIDYS